MSAMVEGIIPQEQARHRLMADITGAGAGLLAFLLWRCIMSPSVSQWGALQLAGLSLATSALAGFVTAFLTLALIGAADSDALRVSRDKKSLIVKKAGWTWTFTPSIVKK